MKHRIRHKQLGRNKNQNKALRRGLLSAIFERGRIETTLPKAKAIVPEVDRVMVFAKNDTVASRREVIKIMGSNNQVEEIFTKVAPMAKDRNSGFTRIIKLGQRFEDATPMAIIELIDYKFVEPVVKKEVVKGEPVIEGEVENKEVVKESKEKSKVEKVPKEKVQKAKPQTTQKIKAVGNK